MDNLPELRDIHLPEEGISVFPIAGGWWFLLILIALAILSVWLLNKIRRAGAKFYARYLLQKIKNEDLSLAVAQMSEILRRICVRKYPQAVALTGNEWIDFLNNKTTAKISKDNARLLENAPYVNPKDERYNKKNVEQLRKFCENWIGENL